MENEQTGHKYGLLTILERVDDYVSPKGVRASQYKCICDCGNKRTTRLQWLKCGKVFACKECTKKSKREKATKDLTGQRFGRWLVLAKADVTKHGVFWNCLCDCGNKGIIRGTSLTTGNSTSCGCFALEKLKKDHELNLIGKRFGRLLVISKVENLKQSSGRNKTRWLCECDCGNTTIVTGSDLTSGGTKSCGCYKADRISETHFKDLTGQRIGMLTIVERVDDYISPGSKRPRPQFLCKCDCGNQKIITKDSLMNGTISCGCINSKGEREISIFLQQHNLNYKIQYSFDDLIGSGNVPLKFDFAVLDNNDKVCALIEFQGEQHYGPIKFFGGIKKYDKQRKYDEMKRKYCKNHNIKLIEISFMDSIQEALSILI